MYNELRHSDGDQLTYTAVKDPKFHPLFITMCPTYAFIDRANGRFNNAMDFKKDYAALISAAWEIDTAFDQYLNNMDEDSYRVIRDMGLVVPLEEDASAEERRVLLEKLAKSNKDNKFRKRFLGDVTVEELFPN